MTSHSYIDLIEEFDMIRKDIYSLFNNFNQISEICIKIVKQDGKCLSYILK